MVTKLILSRLISLQIAYFRNPKYHLYKQKLAEIMKAAEIEDDSRGQRSGIQLDMILENSHEDLGTSPFSMRKITHGGFGQPSSTGGISSTSPPN
jgi:hypothetical protein